jgi:AcrR family transcriptional regulator
VETGITPADAKTQALTTQAIDMVITHPSWTNQQIADELGISRTTLWNLLRGPDAQEIMRRELNEVETTLHQWIHELYSSPSPANKRTATQLLRDIAAKLADKTRPSLTQTQNINLDITLDLNKLHQELQRHNETLRNLPPTTRQQYWDTYNKLHPQT